MRGKTHLGLIVACLLLALALCAWGAVGWRRAYRAEVEADRLRRAEALRDAQLLGIIVRGGAAAAQLAQEGHPEFLQVQ
jgi:hypothetical protein